MYVVYWNTGEVAATVKTEAEAAEAIESLSRFVKSKFKIVFKPWLA